VKFTECWNGSFTLKRLYLTTGECPVHMLLNYRWVSSAHVSSCTFTRASFSQGDCVYIHISTYWYL